MDPDDRRHMRRALELAERGRGTTDPNPLVGCVLVRDGQVVGEGWHERAGGPHAEVAALEDAGDRAVGATAYVTLEPCAHRGRTGPCVAALAEAGVGEVVYAIDDPTPEAGGGAEGLRSAGIAVRSGVLADEAEEQNEGFLVARRLGRPFVTLKLAQSLDGRVAAADGSSRWITGEAARTRVHELRAAADAVMVGSGTVLADDPRLTVRHVDPLRGDPRAVVLDARGRTPVDATVVRDGSVVVTGPSSSGTWREQLASAGADVAVVDEAPGAGGPGRDASGGGVPLEAALAALWDRDVRSVLCEGGPTLGGALVRAGLVDRLVLHIAPTVLGDDATPALVDVAVGTVGDGPRWRFGPITRYGQDVELVLRPIRDGG